MLIHLPFNTGHIDVFDVDVSAAHFDEGLSGLEAGNTESVGGGEEGAEIVANSRINKETLVDRVLA